MSGKDFVRKLLKIPKYRDVFDVNGYFRIEIKKLETKKEIHTQNLIECIVTLSNELVQKDIDMIDRIDQGSWEDVI